MGRFYRYQVDFKILKKNPIYIWNVLNGRILSTFGIELNMEIIHMVFNPNIKYFKPIETIFGLKAINIPTEIRQEEILDLRNDYIANDDNNKYKNYINMKSESSISKEESQSEIINFNNENISNINQRKNIDINKVLKIYI